MPIACPCAFDSLAHRIAETGGDQTWVPDHVFDDIYEIHGRSEQAREASPGLNPKTPK